MRDEKGFVFLLTSVILSALIVGFILLSGVSFQTQKLDSFLMFNARTELRQLYDNHFSQNESFADLSSNFESLSSLLKTKAQSQGHSLRFCFIAFDKTNQFILGNYLGRSCAYSVDGIPAGTIENNSQTILTSANGAATNLSFCDCSFQWSPNKDFFEWLELSEKQSNNILQYYTGLQVEKSGLARLSVSCSDGIQNGSETGVDCGGSCSACPIALSSEISIGSCPAGKTGIGSLPLLDNAHIGLPNYYSRNICLTTGNANCLVSLVESGGTCVLKKYAASNSHIADCSNEDASIDLNISVPDGCGTLTCNWRETACEDGEATIVSAPALSNAHIAQPSYYAQYKICCSIA